MSLLIGFAKREIKKSVIRKFIFSIYYMFYTETVTVVTIFSVDALYIKGSILFL